MFGQGARSNQIGQGGQTGTAGRMRGGLINGEVLAKDDNSVTVKLNDGGSKIVYFASSTAISKMTDGSQVDIVVGKNVMISGTTNSDNSVTAQTISIRPDNLPLGNPGNLGGPNGQANPETQINSELQKK